MNIYKLGHILINQTYRFIKGHNLLAELGVCGHQKAVTGIEHFNAASKSVQSRAKPVNFVSLINSRTIVYSRQKYIGVMASTHI